MSKTTPSKFSGATIIVKREDWPRVVEVRMERMPNEGHSAFLKRYTAASHAVSDAVDIHRHIAHLNKTQKTIKFDFDMPKLRQNMRSNCLAEEKLMGAMLLEFLKEDGYTIHQLGFPMDDKDNIIDTNTYRINVSK